MTHSKGNGMAPRGWPLTDEKGMIMVMAVMMLAVVLMLAITAAITSTAETRLAGRSYQSSQVFYMTEGIAEYAADRLNVLLENDLDPTQHTLDQIVPPSIPSEYTIDYSTIRKEGSFYEQTITTGDYIGLNAYIQKYHIEVQVSRSSETSCIQRTVEHQFIPLFQFGVFYEEDLEIFPGPRMIFSGRIHSNHDIYIGANTGIDINSCLTAVGQIYHWRKDETHVEPTGPVNIRDYWGDYQNMYQDGYWLDSECANWQTEAIARWGGTVRDSSHGVHQLQIPVPQIQHIGHGQIEIIKRGQMGDSQELRDARYYWKADIRVLDGVAYDSSGLMINMGSGTLTQDWFYDQREHRWMYVTQLDLEEMIHHGTAPANGIIYFSGSLLGDGVRLVNGETIPDGGLTVASENPVYILGNYNTSPKRNAAVIG
ncbi:hypothetical protein AMJ86_10415 [bacterium SM23_57]|nr:MAG: hypothetical protein AMJ86_10415 [bacterium SM23_57]